jgi:hypothetical protein
LSGWPRTFVNGSGFPYPGWLVSYAVMDPVRDPATLIFRDTAGREVAVLHAAANEWPVTWRIFP